MTTALSALVAWLELTARSGTMTPFAEVDLNDLADYFGGYKAPLILSWDRIVRGLSDRRGQPEHLSFGATFSDAERFFRTLLDDTVSPRQFLQNCPLLIRAIEDEDRRGNVSPQPAPRVLANGFVTEPRALPGYQYALQGSDWLRKKLSKKQGRGADSAWQPKIDVATFGSTCPQESLGLAMPIIYGEIDPDLASVPSPPDPEAFPRGGAVPGGWSANRYGGGAFGSIPNPTDLVVYVTLLRGGLEYDFAFPLGMTISTTAVTIFAGIYDLQTGDLFRLSFSTDATFNPFDSSTHTGARFIDLDPTIDMTDEPSEGLNAKGYVLASLSTGTLYTGVSGIGGTLPRGAVSVIPVGVEQLSDGEFWTAFLVAGHAVKAIPRVFRNGVVVTTWGGLGGTQLLAPGQTGWSSYFGGTLYRTRGGKRVTLIYAKGATALAALDGTAPLTVDVEGVESVGDCTGTLIRSSLLQYLHWLQNWLAPDTPYATGNWITTPTFAADPTIALIDEASFTTALAVQDELVSGSFEGAVIIGAAGETISALDQIAMFNSDNCVDSGFNRSGQFFVTMEPNEADAGAAAVSDVLDILDGSFGMEDSSQALFNILLYAHTPDYSGRGWLIAAATLVTSERRGDWRVSTEFGDAPIRDEDSITNYDQELESSTVEMWGLRNTTTAGADSIAAVLAWKAFRFARPRRLVTLQVPYDVDHELGDVLQLGALEGLGSAGWVNRQVRVLRDELDPNVWARDLICYDLEPYPA